MVKIAVYAIAKNEEQFVERWYNSALIAGASRYNKSKSNNAAIGYF